MALAALRPCQPEDMLARVLVASWQQDDMVEPPSTSVTTGPASQRLACVFAFTQQAPRVQCTCELLAGGERLVITSDDGEVYEITLPCRMSAVHALRIGLLLQRMPFADEGVSRSSIFFRADGRKPSEVHAIEPPSLPAMFTLLHPLEEPRPVCLAPLTATVPVVAPLASVFTPPTSDEPVRPPPVYVTDVSERVLSCLWRQNLLVTFNMRDGCHAVWTLSWQRSFAMADARPLPDIMHADVFVSKVWSDTSRVLGTTASVDVFVLPSFGLRAPQFTLCCLSSAGLHLLDCVQTEATSSCPCVCASIYPASDDEDASMPLADWATASDGLRVTHTTCVPCTSAAPVSFMCARNEEQACLSMHQSWMLLLHTSGASSQLKLAAADGAILCAVELSGSTPLTHVSCMPDSFELQNMLSSQGALYHAADGSGISRLQLLTESASALVRQACAATDFILPAHEAFMFRCDVMRMAHSLASLKEECVCIGDGLFMRVLRCGNADWNAFINTMQYHMTAVTRTIASPTSVTSNETLTGDEAWAALLQSSFHASFSRLHPQLLDTALLEAALKPIAPATVTRTSSTTSAASPSSQISLNANSSSFIKDHFADVLQALHFVLEDIKLDIRRGDDARLLCQLLLSLSTAAASSLSSLTVYIDFYKRESPDLSPLDLPVLPESSISAHTLQPSVPDIMRAVRTVLSSSSTETVAFDSFLSAPSIACKRLTTIVSLFKQFVLSTTREDAHQLIADLASAGFSLPELRSLPPGVSLPFLDVIHACRANPPMNWSSAAYELVGRHDLAAMSANAASSVDRPVDHAGMCSDFCF